MLTNAVMSYQQFVRKLHLSYSQQGKQIGSSNVSASFWQIKSTSCFFAFSSSFSRKVTQIYSKKLLNTCLLIKYPSDLKLTKIVVILDSNDF